MENGCLVRARKAVSLVDVDPASPFSAANARARSWAGNPIDAARLLGAWVSRHPGSSVGNTRYRWDTNHRHCRLPDFAGPTETWRAWKPAEQAQLEGDPHRFEERLSIPILVAESCELLCELQGNGPVETATQLLYEAEPVFRRDLANCVLAAHAATDTFALSCVARSPRALERLWPIALALATTYADLARRAGGVVLGTRYPFHDKALVSASAQLATGLLRVGSEFPLASRLLDFVRRERRASGGWGDAGASEDVLTTWVAADLLLHLDPSFDPQATATFFASRQDRAGFWRALGPDAAWLTAAIGQWLESAEQPFANRFRWPAIVAANRDRKTGLPFFAYFDDLMHLYAELPGIAAAPTELAFIDLAGFRAFNNAHGQNMGDDVLATFGHELAAIPGCAAVRDGGDEFLLVGAPARKELTADLEAFRHLWPDRFRARFGTDVPPVAPRILAHRVLGGGLGRAREVLGSALGELKQSEPKPGPSGFLREWK
jgi:GGDEF domain-containing protein